MVMLNELATFERALANKTYKEGCTLIQLSATKGEVLYLDKAQKVETKYAVIQPNEKVLPKYLYYGVCKEVEHFMSRYLQGLNLLFEDLKFMAINWTRLEYQTLIVDLLSAIDKAMELEQKIIEFLKVFKEWHLRMMFI